MKIGILSLNPGSNYGGILQSYALKTVLERMGHDVYVISYNQFDHSFKYYKIPQYFKNIVRKLILRRSVAVFGDKKADQRFQNTFAMLLDFSSKHLNLRKVNRLKDIRPDEFEAIVVGSDQVWRPRYFKSHFSAPISDAYLGFAEKWDIRRIAYAPSFGDDKWEYNSLETKKCSNLIKKFDAVSCREYSGVNLCKKQLGVESELLCDPTILLDSKDYESLAGISSSPSPGNLLVYCLDRNNELDSLVERIANENSLKPFSTNVDETKDNTKKTSVEAWIRGFIDAEFVVTDSFHACVFSLIFRKRFVVLGNTSRGMGRFESLLKLFHQEKRLLYKASDYSNQIFNLPLNGVDDIFHSLKAEAMNYLTNNLR